MIRWFLAPLPSLLAAVLAIGLALLYLDHGWKWPLVIVLSSAGAIAISLLVGLLFFARRPYYAGWLLETGLLLLTLGAAIAGAFVLWLLITKAPGDHASTRRKEVWAAFSGAISAYLASVIIKPDSVPINPVKSATKRTFRGRFESGNSRLESDAYRAVVGDRYGATDPSHAGQTVDGWGWDARRLRTRHIQDYLKTL